MIFPFTVVVVVLHFTLGFFFFLHSRFALWAFFEFYHFAALAVNMQCGGTDCYISFSAMLDSIRSLKLSLATKSTSNANIPVA